MLKALSKLAQASQQRKQAKLPTSSVPDSQFI